MKKLTTVSLFIFGVVVSAILTAGLVFYQNNKGNQGANSQTGSYIQNTINKISTSGGSLTLNMTEISKHNIQSDCWMLINGKVYDITNYFGIHPGGSGVMDATCGKDATSAYNTKDPYSTSSSTSSAHSSGAVGLLGNYFIGNFNQTINQQTLPKIYSTNSVPPVNNVSSNDD